MKLKEIKEKLIGFCRWLRSEWEKGAEIQARYEKALEERPHHRWYAVRGGQ